jgi:RNA polymerase sigma-70 factor (ECF subfamily)
MLFENPYTLRLDDNDGKDIMRYFVSFKDGEGIHRETEISRPIFNEFLKFDKIERNLTRWGERHIEQSEQTDETLWQRMVKPPKSLEETVFDSERNERLRLAIQQLPEIQRRRFVLHHEIGLTYEQIGEMGGCTFQAVAKSAKAAETTIKKYFENWG